MVIQARDVINSISDIGKKQISEEKSRHPKYEFQAFAYKIAHDLGDLENLHIYMSLLKKVERIFIEEAYTFAVDSSSVNKKKVFLWKLKQLRNSRDLQIQNNDYTFENVLKRMRIFRDKYHAKILLRYDHCDEFVNFVCTNLTYSKYKKVLLICFPYKDLIMNLQKLSNNISFYDYSKSIQNYINNLFKHLKLLSWKNILKLPKSSTKYDLIILDHIFSIIPFEYELLFFESINKLLSSTSQVFIRIKLSDNKKQYWVNLKDTQDYYFEKLSNLLLVDKIKDHFDIQQSLISLNSINLSLKLKAG